MNPSPVEMMQAAIPIIALTFCGLIALAITISWNIRRGIERRGLEESRREISAYVAEGSMTVDQAERLLNAGPKACGEQTRQRM